MKKLLFLFPLLFFGTTVQAQKYLPGLWSGTLTQGEDTYRVEIFLIRNQDYLTGQSYVYLPNGEVTASEIRGKLHQDLSMNVYDTKIVKPDAEVRSDSLHFQRHFQLLYSRSFDELELRGYWQDWHHSAGDPQRRQGKIILRRKASKA